MVSPIDYRGSSLTASPRILNQKKKKINTENQKIPITSLVTSLPEKSNPNITAYTKQISKTKSNSSKAKPNTDSQSDRGVYLKKKKKIPNTQTKTKPQQTKPRNPRSRRRDAVARRRSPLIADRRPQIADRRSLCASASAPVLGAGCSPSGPPSRYFSLFLSLK